MLTRALYLLHKISPQINGNALIAIQTLWWPLSPVRLLVQHNVYAHSPPSSQLTNKQITLQDKLFLLKIDFTSVEFKNG